MLESLTMTRITFQNYVCHELHFDSNGASTLAFFTSSTFGIEREKLRCESKLLCQWLFGKQGTNIVVGFDISSRIRA